MNFLGKLLFIVGLGVAAAVAAADNVLLIQTGPAGFTVWHVEGSSVLPDDDVIDIMATARPEGGEIIKTPLGPAQAFQLADGVMIGLPEAPRDRAWLVDRDACGHIHLWHAEGTTQLTDAQLSDIYMSALPEGGPRLRLGAQYAKGFIGKLGVTVTLWSVPAGK
ncbi:MAG: hypothetical protein Q8M20_01680 [Rhodocyclaceae bacterium]|nr:hypothetical protein [Rhodocyclaceae bacterium]MDZ4216545.1 hypothetical protein [Rhodocyclaceae bacterium]